VSVLTCGRAVAVLKGDHSAQEGRAEMSNEVCGPASERRTRCIRGLHPVSGPTGHLDKLASKLKYESVGRSRLSQQSRRINSRFPDFPGLKRSEKGNKSQRSGAMFRALSTIIVFGRLQTLQGDELSRTVATRAWSLIETETSSSSAAAAVPVAWHGTRGEKERTTQSSEASWRRREGVQLV